MAWLVSESQKSLPVSFTWSWFLLSSKEAAISLVPSLLRPYLRRIETSPTGSRLARGAFWSLSGALASRILALASSIFVARMLGKEGFGELGIIQSTVGMFQVFAGFGLGLTATKYVAEYHSTDPEKAGRIVGLSSLVSAGTGALLALAMVLFAPWLALNTLAAPHLAGLLRLSAVMLVLGALSGAQIGVLSGFEDFKAIARISLIAGLANFPLVVGGVYLAGVKGAVLGLIASMGVNWLLNHVAVRSALRRIGVTRSLDGCSRELRVLWRFSVPAVLSGVMFGPIMWACYAMLVNQRGGYGEMGIFNAANQWRGAILFLPGAVGAIILPVLSNLRGQGDRPRYKKVLAYNVWFNGGVTLSVAIVVSLTAPFIMATYGNGFRSSYVVLVLLSFSAVLSATIGVIGEAIASEDRMWSGMFLNLLWGCVMIGATWFLVGHGAVGLALALLIAYIFHLLTVGAYTYMYLLDRPSGENPTGSL
jgi:O-antigen/teichoic acid export membrane protein